MNVFRGKADVVVCDGFDGNIVLKTGEGVAEMVLSMVRQELTRHKWMKLFLLPLREFTAARDRLAAQLVAAKQRDRARVVKALRRPTVAAWVVNQLAHRHAAAVRRLLDAGAVLRRAQYALGRRGSADDFRAATKRRQETLRELRALAAPLLREAGSAAHLDDVLATLEVASVDPAAAKAVTSGRLSRELPRPAGFGDTHDAHQLMLVPSDAATLW